MAHQFLMFLAPYNAATQGLPQATVLKPPAYPSQATSLVSEVVPASAPRRVPTFRFFSSVVGNAIGFCVFIAGCYSCLQLIQTFL